MMTGKVLITRERETRLREMNASCSLFLFDSIHLGLYVLTRHTRVESCHKLQLVTGIFGESQITRKQESDNDGCLHPTLPLATTWPISWYLPHQSGSHWQNTPLQLTVSIDGVETFFECSNPSSLFGDGYHALHISATNSAHLSCPTPSMLDEFVTYSPSIGEYQRTPSSSPPLSSFSVIYHWPAGHSCP